MFKEYGIPYVIGMPVGYFTDKLCEDLRHTAEGHAAERHTAEQHVFSVNKTLSCAFKPAYADRHADRNLAVTEDMSLISKAASALSSPDYADALSFDKPDASSIRKHAVSASDSELAIIGEPVTSGSIAAAIAALYNINVSVLCPLEGCDIFLTANDYSFKGEKQCTELMKRYKHIIADPLYLPICPDSVSFHRLPHAAFSGRCCMNEMRNLITLLDERQL